MSSSIISRHYPIPNLSFRDFWDICSRFQSLNPDFQQVSFTVDGHESILVLNESNVASILKKIEGKEDKVRKYAARFYSVNPDTTIREGLSELEYRPHSFEKTPQGLTFYSDSVDKAGYYHFEEDIHTHYKILESAEPKVEFGRPCEILALVIDIRGFSMFCEEPNIESPYICGLMSAFYNLVTKSLERFPPDLIKFVGDGVVAIWRTKPEDREIAITVALGGTLSLKNGWRRVRDEAHFTHGAPEGIGAGISFGLASHLESSDDYIGRCINIASRLCGACPGGRVYVDKSVPGIPLQFKKHDFVAHIKPYGRHHIWSFMNENN